MDCGFLPCHWAKRTIMSSAARDFSLTNIGGDHPARLFSVGAGGFGISGQKI
jgi:hypothetical protein